MENTSKPVDKSSSLIGFLISIPIGLLGGLIGLGGAEFRLPVLIGMLKVQARDAVPINLIVSLVTLVVSLVTRINVVSDFPYQELLPILLAMILGAMVMAFWMAGLAVRFSNYTLEWWIKVLLISIGFLLIVEGFVPVFSANLIKSGLVIRTLVGLTAGGVVGMVSSILGVAGGELIIPTLIFIFGVGVKQAGTASLIISIPTVLTGLARYFQRGQRINRVSFTRIVAPMSLGSLVGSILGGLLFGLVSASLLKMILGVVLIFSALRMFLTRSTGSR